MAAWAWARLLCSTTVLGVFIANTQAEPFVDLMEVMLAGDGVWYLAAAGTTGKRPPWESCVKTTIKDTGRLADCAVMYHNHTFSKTRIIFYLGINEENHTEIRSKGPTHQYMIKTTKKIGHGANEQLSTPKEFIGEMNYDGALNSPICWFGKGEVPLEWRYLIMPVNDKNPVDAFFLIGIRARLQAPEYQIGIFTKGILDQDYVYSMAQEINRKNRIHFMPLCNIDRSKTYGYWFPPYCLPNLYVKCAIGYKLWDVTNKYNINDKEDDDEVKSINTGVREKMAEMDENGLNHDATKTIWVRHQ